MSQNNSHGHGSHQEEHHEHFIMPDAMAFKIWGALIVGTVITVLISLVHLGWANMFVAMVVATAKASLVCVFFMGMKYDKKDNIVIFLTSFIFATIFMVLTSSDIFFRTEPKELKVIAQKSGPSKFKKAWNSSPELLANGKAVFNQQCVICHGEAGQGNGSASAGLNPKPRNFTADSGWKNGRKPSQIFGTLTKGLNSMPAFGNLSSDDRWSLTHYVIAFGPKVESDSAADLAKIGIDSSKDDGGGAGVEKSISVDQAIETIAVDGKYKAK